MYEIPIYIIFLVLKSTCLLHSAAYRGSLSHLSSCQDVSLTAALVMLLPTLLVPKNEHPMTLPKTKDWAMLLHAGPQKSHTCRSMPNFFSKNNKAEASGLGISDAHAARARQENSFGKGAMLLHAGPTTHVEACHKIPKLKPDAAHHHQG